MLYMDTSAERVVDNFNYILKNFKPTQTTAGPDSQEYVKGTLIARNEGVAARNEGIKPLRPTDIVSILLRLSVSDMQDTMSTDADTVNS
jgi:hypothetical protein